VIRNTVWTGLCYRIRSTTTKLSRTSARLLSSATSAAVRVLESVTISYHATVLRCARRASSGRSDVPPRRDGAWLQVQVSRAQHDRIKAHCKALQLPVLTWCRAAIMTDVVNQALGPDVRRRGLYRVRAQDPSRTMILLRISIEQRRQILARSQALNESVSSYGRRVLLAAVSRAEAVAKIARLRTIRKMWGFG
jgi:hypothetical protein